MAKSISAKLAYFERWMQGHAVEMLNGSEAIELTHLRFADNVENNLATLTDMHGYQILPRTELDERYLAAPGLFDQMPQLLAVCSTGAGYDMIDVDACTSRGIIVCNQSGSNAQAVAEYVLAVMLSLSKQISLVDRAMRQIDRLDRMHYCGNDIQHKTIGIIGIGQIGRRVAQIAQAFDMRVLAYDPHVSEEEISRRGAQSVDWQRLFADSDFVTVHCPRNDETLNMIDASAYALMKDSAFFISAARGGIHNEEDLYQVLTNRRIAGAALDVWWQEPTPKSHPLLQLDNVIATPHFAGVTDEAMTQMGVIAAQQWQQIFAGQVPPRLINPQAWPSYQQRFEQVFGHRPQSLGGAA